MSVLTLLLLLLFYVLIVITSHTKSETIIKQGYGVHFDLVDHIIADGDTMTYTHTWQIPWLNIRNGGISQFDCSRAADWRGRCLVLQEFIHTVDSDVFEITSNLKGLVRTAIHQIPVSLNESLTAESSDTNERRQDFGNGRRKKRQATANTTLNGAELPDWLKTQTSDIIHDGLDYLPVRIVGQIWSDLTNSPGPKDLRALRSHLRSVGSAVYENIQGVKQFNSDITSLSQLTNGRIDNAVALGQIVNDRIAQTQRGIRNLYNKTSDILATERARLDHIDHIYRITVGDILPAVMKYRAVVLEAAREVDRWLAGITRLTEGYISPFLVRPDEMGRVLNYVSESVLTKPRYKDLRLPSSHISYYYTLKNVAYTHVLNNISAETHETDSTLYVSLNIPLYAVGGLLPLYEVTTYPVPLAAGLQVPTVINYDDKKIAFTRFVNVADFIAVSQTTDLYVEVSRKTYLSCGGSPGARFCRSGMNVVRKASVENTTCTFAIFTENNRGVSTTCDIRYEDTDRWKPLGSAFQLSQDSTFLVHASQRGPGPDMWRIACQQSSSRPGQVTPVQPCDMCRLRIPCGCSLTGRDFFLPPRLSGCNATTTTTTSNVTYVYTVNTALMTNFYPQSALGQLRSFDELDRKIHPPFHLPDITFDVPDLLSQYVERDDAFQASLNDTFARAQMNLSSYTVREEAALNKTRNFTDSVSSKMGDIEAALEDVLNLFGGDIKTTLALIFSPLFIGLLALVPALIQFVPNAIFDYKKWKTKRKRSQKSMEQLLST